MIPQRAEEIEKVYNKKRLVRNFDFEGIWHEPISRYLTPFDLKQLYYIATSPKFNAKPKTKFLEMDKIMLMRGFTRFASGTNRIVYKSEYDASILLKVALDEVGLSDNIGEYFNQHAIKPFCTKVFDVSQNHAVSMVERVNEIPNRVEFQSVAGVIFDLLNSVFIGRYVLEDIGCDFFMNWGIREGFGPVLLDFPYCYVLDGNKLTCKAHNRVTGHECGGLIDYDEGLNTLVCEKCGKRYTARSLGKNLELKSMQCKIEESEADDMEHFTVGTTINGVTYTLAEEDSVIHRPSKNIMFKDPVMPKEEFAVKANIRSGKVKEGSKVITIGDRKLFDNRDQKKIRFGEEQVKPTEFVDESEFGEAVDKSDELNTSVAEATDAKVSPSIVTVENTLDDNFAKESAEEKKKLEESEMPKQINSKERMQGIDKEIADVLATFSFTKYPKANQKRRDAMIDFAKESIMSKFHMDLTSAYINAERIVDANYQFTDEDDDESATDETVTLEEKYGIDPNESGFEKVRKNRMSEF